MTRSSLGAVAAALLASPLLFGAGQALAAGEHGGGHGRAAIGAPGEAAAADRTVEIAMYDNYYEPERLEVAGGQTVRFLVRNEGSLVHEFNIGTAEQHAAHRDEMMMMVEHGVLLADRIDRERMKMDMGGGRTMEHDDPSSLLLEPGETAELVWTFPESGTLEFACNVPGHYEAGMVGDLGIQK
ncbi:MAG: cupredoxin domain-containing protein [Tistlia sp.]|uniref:cupredoxin domain-containing protein n=1 Tax=Tistlia sp. TaxID=3057121 RepID=UPI0034A3C5D9